MQHQERLGSAGVDANHGAGDMKQRRQDDDPEHDVEHPAHFGVSSHAGVNWSNRTPSRMRPFSARLPLLYRSMTAATSSSRVAMLTRLIAISPTPSGSEHFR